MKDYYLRMNLHYSSKGSTETFFDEMLITESFLHHLDSDKYKLARDKIIDEIKIYKIQYCERKKMQQYINQRLLFSSPVKKVSLDISILLEEYQIDNLPSLVVNTHKILRRITKGRQELQILIQTEEYDKYYRRQKDKFNSRRRKR